MGREGRTGRLRPSDAAGDAEGSALARRCRPLIEAAPLPMAVVEGPQHLVRSVNPAFCRVIGAAAETVIGRPFAEVVPAWAGSQALLDRVARTGAAETLVDQPQARPAAGVWSWTVWPVEGPGRRPVGLMILVPETPDTDQFRQQLTAMNQALVVASVRQHELTDAAEALTAQVTAQKALLEAILEQAAEEIVVRDAQGRLLLANAEVRRWLRPGPDGPAALEGTPLDRVPHLWGDMLDADGQPIPVEAYPIARALRGERVPPLEFHRAALDGRTRALLNSAAPIVDPQGAMVGAVAISIDITPQKATEADLRQARDELERRVAERTVALSRAVQTLEAQAAQLRALAAELTRAEQRERRRLAMRLHDEHQQLLAAAQHRVSLLAREEAPQVQAACQEITALLEEALAHSRSLAQELSPPILATRNLPDALEWLARWMAEKHHLEVAVQADATAVPASEDLTDLCFQAVRELLFNVVKHAKVQSARVELTRRDDQVEILVADAGVGFDPTFLWVEGGVLGGFGLFSIRQRVELLGGTLTIASAPGQGGRFTLTVPLRPSP